MLKNIEHLSIKPIQTGVYTPTVEFNMSFDLRNKGIPFEQYPVWTLGSDGPSKGFDERHADYGVADTLDQILEFYQGTPVHDDRNRHFIIEVSEVNKRDQPESYGWRWHKWGEYIGEHEITQEYLHDEPVVERVLCWSLLEIKQKG